MSTDHDEEKSTLPAPRTAQGQAIGVETGAEAPPEEGGARAELTVQALQGGWRETMQEAIDCLADVAQYKGNLKIGVYRHVGQKLRDLLAAAPPQTDHPDTARLDWLERHPRLAEFVVDGRATDCYLYAVSGAPGLKLREIIDAAMRAEPSKPASAEVGRG